jgi:GDPmannose 4,6-dehydratase
MQWMVLQAAKPDDYVIATGEQHTVREFASLAAETIGLNLTWRGMGVEEHAVDQFGNRVIAVDPKYFRPTEVETLLGDASHARKTLNWHPRISFTELVSEMARADMLLAEKEKVSGQYAAL